MLGYAAQNELSGQYVDHVGGLELPGDTPATYHAVIRPSTAERACEALPPHFDAASQLSNWIKNEALASSRFSRPVIPKAPLTDLRGIPTRRDF